MNDKLSVTIGNVAFDLPPVDANRAYGTCTHFKGLTVKVPADTTKGYAPSLLQPLVIHGPREDMQMARFACPIPVSLLPASLVQRLDVKTPHRRHQDILGDYPVVWAYRRNRTPQDALPLIVLGPDGQDNEAEFRVEAERRRSVAYRKWCESDKGLAALRPVTMHDVLTHSSASLAQRRQKVEAAKVRAANDILHGLEIELALSGYTFERRFSLGHGQHKGFALHVDAVRIVGYESPRQIKARQAKEVDRDSVDYKAGFEHGVDVGFEIGQTAPPGSELVGVEFLKPFTDEDLKPGKSSFPLDDGAELERAIRRGLGLPEEPSKSMVDFLNGLLDSVRRREV